MASYINLILLLGSMLLQVLTFACGSCRCSNKGDAYSMFCIGPKIADNFTQDIALDIKQKTGALHLMDTAILSLNENLCDWNELLSLFLNHNDYLNCSTLHHTVHSCLSIYRQCYVLNGTTLIPPQTFKYTYSIFTLCKVFIGILIGAVAIICKQMYQKGLIWRGQKPERKSLKSYQ